ncbi:hypothetical protein [uncultured Senegalimassilia sp.]|uniref:hypothetical protein n=1 Tax=uncultured Senegalimassilia sp. TaxID=1714350 RepID=UPI0025FA8655|nr:hypothetical protein [uncultured Senegalimassilia sp.]
MGLFSAISKAMQAAQEKAELEAAPVIRQIDQNDLSYGGEKFCAMARQLSPSARTAAGRAYQRKIDVSGKNEIYQAFEQMYGRYQQRGDTMAFALSQMLGKKLAQDEDSRVKEKSNDDGSKTLYLPRGY